MNAKHTPGPWEVQWHYMGAKDIETAKAHGMDVPRALTNDGECPVMAGTGDDRCRVALVSSHTAFKRGKGWEVYCTTRDANARLIAAAPMMLEALESIRVFAQDCIENSHDRGSLGNLYSIRDLCDRIAAATGTI